MDAPVVRGSGRLEAYSDALFSIIATVMVSRFINSLNIIQHQST